MSSHPLALDQPRLRGWALALVGLLGLVAAGALLSHHPGTTVGLILTLTVFATGFLAPLELAFPLLGFLIVFDSVFSLGTQINASALVVIGFSVSNPLLVALTGRLLAEAALRRHRLNSQGLWLGGVVVAGAVLSSYFSTGGFTRATATYVGAGMVVLVITSYGTPALVRRLLLGVGVGTLLSAVSGLAALVTASGGIPRFGRAFDLIGTSQISIPRVSGLYQNPNALAVALLAGLFAALASIRTRGLRWMMVAAILPILVFTYGRGSIAGVVLGIFAFVAVRAARRRNEALGIRATRGLGMFSFSLFAGAIVLIAVLIWAGRSPLLARFWNSDSITFRLQIGRVALDTWKANPILGIGPGQFLARFFVEAHDTFLQVGAEMGIVGFVPVVALYVLALTRSARRTLLASDPEEVRASAWIAGGVVAMAVVAATLTLLGVKEMWAFLSAAAIPLSAPEPVPRRTVAARADPFAARAGPGGPGG